MKPHRINCPTCDKKVIINKRFTICKSCGSKIEYIDKPTKAFIELFEKSLKEYEAGEYEEIQDGFID
jgi:DNA-directed RNA polymerase subunit RPC12/RpoP